MKLEIRHGMYPTESSDFPCLETSEVTYPCSIVEYLGL